MVEMKTFKHGNKYKAFLNKATATVLERTEDNAKILIEEDGRQWTKNVKVEVIKDEVSTQERIEIQRKTKCNLTFYSECLIKGAW